MFKIDFYSQNYFLNAPRTFGHFSNREFGDVVL